jgi:predicted RNA binding protein YcfA (HicA-like mRNA interferase family)
MSAKEAKALIKAAEKAGWRTERGGGGHVKIYPPTGPIITAGNSGGKRGSKNLRADLRRAGLDV